MTVVQPSAIAVRRATRADIPFLAQIDEIASLPPFEESIWEGLLRPFNTPTPTFLEAMFATDASAWGQVEDYIVLEHDGSPMAGCVIFQPDMTATDTRPLRMDRLPALAEKIGWSDKTTKAFINHYNKLWGPPDAPVFASQALVIIENVGVLPDYRGQGLGRRLLQEAIAVASDTGLSHVGIMIIHGNDPAQRLYESLGFQPYVTYYTDFFDNQFPGVTKYRMALTEG